MLDDGCDYARGGVEALGKGRKGVSEYDMIHKSETFEGTGTYAFEENIVTLKTTSHGVLESKGEHDEAGIVHVAVSSIVSLTHSKHGAEGRSTYKGNKPFRKTQPGSTESNAYDSEKSSGMETRRTRYLPSFFASLSNLALASSSNLLNSSSYFIVIA
jgi:hypothetical protein